MTAILTCYYDKSNSIHPNLSRWEFQEPSLYKTEKKAVWNVSQLIPLFHIHEQYVWWLWEFTLKLDCFDFGSSSDTEQLCELE